MQTSELIKLLAEQINKHGDKEICICHPTGVYKNIVVLDESDYYDGGYGLLGGECVNDKTVIDYE